MTFLMRRALPAAAVLALAACAAAVVLTAAPQTSLADKIHVAPPPPPPPATAPAQTFDYKHEVKKVVRDRKPVVALLRQGDVIQWADFFPFGRGTTITEARDFSILTQGRRDEPVYMPPSVRQYLMRELLQTGEFIVLERERIIEIMRELAFAKTGAVNAETAPRPGRIIGVHYIIEGSFFGTGGLPPDDPALDGVKNEIKKRRLNIDPRAACVMYLTIYKVETGEVKAVACGADLQPLVAVKKAVEDLVDQLGDVVEPIKLSQVNANTGQAIIDIGSDGGAKAGDQYTLTLPAPPAPPGPAGAAGTAGATTQETPKPAATAKVLQTWPLYSLVEVPADQRAQVKDGQEARPVAAPAAPAAPPAAPPAPPPASPAPAETGNK
ncbi:MAG: hypothetical protein NTY65_03910 [Planctomycetota bacterium]|nr:hypothetical protein [Planctomycetota bacterium]